MGMDLCSHMGCLYPSWVLLDFLFESFVRPTRYEIFIDEFYIPYDLGKKRRPMVFAIALLVLLVFPLEDINISTHLGSVDFDHFHDKHGSKVTPVPMILAKMYHALTEM